MGVDLLSIRVLTRRFGHEVDEDSLVDVARERDWDVVLRWCCKYIPQVSRSSWAFSPVFVAINRVVTFVRKLRRCIDLTVAVTFEGGVIFGEDVAQQCDPFHEKLSSLLKRFYCRGKASRRYKYFPFSSCSPTAALRYLNVFGAVFFKLSDTGM